jgi:hypothetical protein
MSRQLLRIALVAGVIGGFLCTASGQARAQWTEVPGGGQVSAGIAAVQVGMGVQIFGIGMDQQVWTNFINGTNGTWSGWTVFSSTTNRSLGSTYSPFGRELIRKGTDNLLYVSSYSNGSWGSWRSVPAHPTGNTVSAPSIAVLSNTPRSADWGSWVFAVGSDGNVWRIQEVGYFGTWENLGNPGASATDVVVNTTTQSPYGLSISVRTVDGLMWTRVLNTSTGTFYSWGQDKMQSIFPCSADQALRTVYHQASTSKKSANWSNIGGKAGCNEHSATTVDCYGAMASPAGTWIDIFYRPEISHFYYNSIFNVYNNWYAFAVKPDHTIWYAVNYTCEGKPGFF